MKYGAIAAGDKHTLESALEILRLGGNAFDAAVGAVFTSMTSEFALTSAGGGGALLAFPKNLEPILFDFFVNTIPTTNTTLDFFPIEVDFGTTKQSFNIGKGSVAVPGNIAGLLHVHKRLGSLPINHILEPAILMAKKGVVLNKNKEYLIKILEPILTFTRHGKSIFKPKGSLLKKGDKVILPNFADFLIQLSREGKDFFYKNTGADLIVSALRGGGLITGEHLMNYKVIERLPLKSDFLNHTLYTNPSPSIGGTQISFLLQIISDTIKHIKLDSITIAQSMHLTNQAKNEFYFNQNDKEQINNMLQPETLIKYMKKLKKPIIISKTKNKNIDLGSTTHLSILDKQGNAASVTTTNGEGSGYFVPELGFMMNNMLGEKILNPGGYHLWKKEQRLPTLISPTIVLEESGTKLILGSGGSNRIATAISQVIINSLLHKMNLFTAISSPRMHLEENILHYEPGIILNDRALSKYFAKVSPWQEKNLFFGGVNAVSPVSAVGDQRRGGVGGVF